MKEAFDKYLDSYISICPEITETELNLIRSNLSTLTLQKKEFYLRSGDLQKMMGFVYTGLLRSYYVNNEGKKITIGFIYEGKYASDYPSFIKQKPSKYFIEVLEPTIIVNLPFTIIKQAYKLHRNMEKYGRLIAEQILFEKQDRIEQFLFANAEQRYLEFLDNNPNLINRISLSHLSSYLGIERQSLSRIRKNLSKK